MSLSELDEYEHVLDGTLPARKLFSGSLHGVIPQVSKSCTRSMNVALTKNKALLLPVCIG